MDFNIQDEIRCGYKVTANMKKIWKVELEMLQKLLEVCEKHGLKCWVDSGTLLGAVRHKGFIPWDDDIDVVMFRDDYDKLMKIGPSEFKHPLFFQSAYTDINYFRGHIQIRNSLTTAVIPKECKREFNQGIFIDVFPLDGMPNTEKERSELKRRSIMMQRKMERYHHFPLLLKLNLLSSWLEQKQIEKEIDAKTFRGYYGDYENMFRSNKVEDCDYLTYYSSFPLDYLIDKHIFDNTILADFEYLKVPIPYRYQDYLTLLYGEDYMTPIKSPTYHGELFFDPDHSYLETLPSFRKEWDKKKWLRLKQRLVK